MTTDNRSAEGRTVQRYYIGTFGSMEPSKYGDYVLYEDYDRLRTELDSRTRELEDARASATIYSLEVDRRIQELKEVYYERDSLRSKVASLEAELAAALERVSELNVYTMSLDARGLARIKKLESENAALKRVTDEKVERAYSAYHEWVCSPLGGDSMRDGLRAALQAALGDGAGEK